MKHVFCPISLIPVRSDTSHKSEQVSQMLFGETASILEFSGEWIHIKINQDQYSGWIEKKSIVEISYDEIQLIRDDYFCINKPNNKISVNNSQINLAIGSIIPYSINLYGEFSLANIQFKLENFESLNKEFEMSSVVELAKSLINTPYLWGGKTQWGIDCSGFVQVLFRCLGVVLPRDASQQVKLGESIDIYSAQVGDLAFFENENGYITHVGLIIEDNKIIHASGKVRIDKLDSIGILPDGKTEHTHKLRSIQRISYGSI